MLIQKILSHSDVVKGEILNVGSGEAVTVKQVVEKVRQLMKSKIPIRTRLSKPANEYASLVADISKLKERLDWEPQYSLQDGLQLTIDWFVKHKSWYDTATV